MDPPQLGGTSYSFAWELRGRVMTILSVHKGLNGMEKTPRAFLRCVRENINYNY